MRDSRSPANGAKSAKKRDDSQRSIDCLYGSLRCSVACAGARRQHQLRACGRRFAKGDSFCSDSGVCTDAQIPVDVQIEAAIVDRGVVGV